jgi:hypothetical protein
MRRRRLLGRRAANLAVSRLQPTHFCAPPPFSFGLVCRGPRSGARALGLLGWGPVGPCLRLVVGALLGPACACFWAWAGALLGCVSVGARHKQRGWLLSLSLYLYLSVSKHRDRNRGRSRRGRLHRLGRDGLLSSGSSAGSSLFLLLCPRSTHFLFRAGPLTSG